MNPGHSRTVDLALLLGRVSFGLQMAAFHGWGKLQNLLGDPTGFSDPLGIGWRNSLRGAVAGEFLCSILIILGLFTRVGAFGMAFTMGVAAFVVHGADPWKRKELALLYLTAAVVLLLTGAGRWSADALLRPRLARLWTRMRGK